MKNVTVSMPLEEFENLRALKDFDKEDGLASQKRECDYIVDLIDDIISGQVDSSHAIDFYFFQTPVGEFIKNNFGAYESFRATKRNNERKKPR